MFMLSISQLKSNTKVKINECEKICWIIIYHCRYASEWINSQVGGRVRFNRRARNRPCVWELYDGWSIIANTWVAVDLRRVAKCSRTISEFAARRWLVILWSLAARPAQPWWRINEQEKPRFKVQICDYTDIHNTLCMHK